MQRVLILHGRKVRLGFGVYYPDLPMGYKMPTRRKRMSRNDRVRAAAGAAATAAVGIWLAGCGQWRQPEQVLSAEAFVPHSPAVASRDDTSANPIDTVPRPLYSNVNLELYEQGGAAPPSTRGGGISPTVRESV